MELETLDALISLQISRPMRNPSGFSKRWNGRRRSRRCSMDRSRRMTKGNIRLIKMDIRLIRGNSGLIRNIRTTQGNR